MSDIAAVGEKRVFEPFDKEAFKKEILNNIKYLFRKTPETASQQEIFQAVAYASKDMIIDEWLNAHKEYEKQDAKTVYYLSMEFLMGRALGNNLINLCCYKEVAEVTAGDGTGYQCRGRPGAGCGSWQWRPWSSGGLLS